MTTDEKLDELEKIDKIYQKMYPEGYEEYKEKQKQRMEKIISMEKHIEELAETLEYMLTAPYVDTNVYADTVNEVVELLRDYKGIISGLGVERWITID